MTKWKALSVYETTSDKIGLICELLHKQRGDFLYELFNSMTEALERSVQNHGKLTLDWQIHTKLTGNKLEIMFLPKAKVVSEKVDMDSPEPSASEIAKRTGVEK